MTDNEHDFSQSDPTPPDESSLPIDDGTSIEYEPSYPDDEPVYDDPAHDPNLERMPDETEAAFVDEVMVEESTWQSDMPESTAFYHVPDAEAEAAAYGDEILPFDSTADDWVPVTDDALQAGERDDTPPMTTAELAALVKAQRALHPPDTRTAAIIEPVPAQQVISDEETDEQRQAREQAEREAEERRRAFEDLNLAQAAARLITSPAETIGMISEVARTAPDDSAPKADPRRPAFAPRKDAPPPMPRPVRAARGQRPSAGTLVTPTNAEPVIDRMTESARPPRPLFSPPRVRPSNDGGGAAALTPAFTWDLAIPALERPLSDVRRLTAIQWVMRVIGFVFAVLGMGIITSANIPGDEVNLNAAAPYWAVAFALWLVSEALIGTRPPMRAARQAEQQPAPLYVADDSAFPAIGFDSYALRAVFGVITLVLCFLSWRLTSGNLVTTGGFFAWIASMLMAAWTFAPRGWSPLRVFTGTVAWLRGLKFEFNWTVVALLAIIVLGSYFRLTNLDTPPDQTSDHVEKILNAVDVLEGRSRVFFSENGGREPIQMYLMALLSQVPLPGLGVNFHTLKLLTALEGIITLPVLFWFGRAVVGREDRRLGDLVGLATAGLVAVSYWHEILSHLGLRIVLTSLVTALLLIFLIRGLRTGNRSQFILAGLTLGIGLYTYQAVRMLPLVVIAGFIIAGLYYVQRREKLVRLFFNGAVLVAVAFVCFVPLLGFIVEFPDDFLRRTSTRLLGDDPVIEVDAQGNEISRAPTFFEAVGQSAPQFFTNYRNAALAYNFRGDSAWFQSAPFFPLMDAITGAFLICGAAGWIGLLLRRRDPGFDVIIPAALIMLLPSALAIAFPNENPSNTRLSGTLPMVYVLAGYGFALLAHQTARFIGGKIGFIGVGAVSAGLVLSAYSANLYTFGVEYRTEYINSSYPYSVPAQQLKDFAQNGGSYGNAFIIFYPYWWDHRGIAIDAGAYSPLWPHAIIGYGEENRDGVPEWMRDAFRRTDQYRYDPNLPILFFYEDRDEETQVYLERWFPEGTWERIEPSYSPTKSYRIYRVPPLGEERFTQWLADNGSPLQ